MYKINLPAYDAKLIKRADGLYILDIIRKIYVCLTPEEWVRQHFLNYLIFHMGYPKSVIKVEGSFYIGSLNKRADIVVYNKEGNAEIVIECKAGHVRLSEKVIQQVSFYHSKLLPQYIVVTNGLEQKTIQMENKPHYIENIPRYQ